VSCLVRVGYNGPVLTQAGKLFTCQTFESVVEIESPNAGTPQADTYLDRYSGDFSLIQNGLWANTSNITSHADGIESVVAPLDPQSQIYTIPGRPQFDPTSVYPTSSTTKSTYTLETGAIPQIVFAGQNFPANTNCITVDIYSVYEIIPDPTMGFIAREEVFDIGSGDYEAMAKAVHAVPKTREANASAKKAGFFGKAASLLERVVKSPLTGQVVSTLLGALA